MQSSIITIKMLSRLDLMWFKVKILTLGNTLLTVVLKKHPFQFWASLAKNLNSITQYTQITFYEVNKAKLLWKENGKYLLYTYQQWSQ